jgi:hypothetical protein
MQLYLKEVKKKKKTILVTYMSKFNKLVLV